MLSFVNVLSFVSESKDPGVLSQSLNWNGIPNDARRARYRPCSKVDTVGKSCRACCVISGRDVPFVRIRKDAASPRAVHLRADSECRPRRPGGSGSSRGAVPVDETCPISTEGWTRRVHFVREGGGLQREADRDCRSGDEPLSGSRRSGYGAGVPRREPARHRCTHPAQPSETGGEAPAPRAANNPRPRELGGRGVSD